MADNISLDSTESDPAEADEEDSDSILATSLLQSDLALFDPMLTGEGSPANLEESKVNISRTNSWLIKSLTICAEMELDTDSNSEQLEGSLIIYLSLK